MSSDSAVNGLNSSLSTPSITSSKRRRDEPDESDEKVSETSSKADQVAGETFSLCDMIGQLGSVLSGTVLSFFVDPVNKPEQPPGNWIKTSIVTETGVVAVIAKEKREPVTEIEQVIALVTSELDSQEGQSEETIKSSFYQAVQQAYEQQPTICGETVMAEIERIRHRWPSMPKFIPSVRSAINLSCTAKPDDPLFSQFLGESDESTEEGAPPTESFLVQELQLDGEDEDDNPAFLEAKPEITSAMLKRVAMKSPSLTSLTIEDAILDFGIYEQDPENERLFLEEEEPSPELCFPRVERVKFHYCNIDHTSALSAAIPSVRHLTFTNCAVRREAFLTLLKGKEGLQSLVFDQDAFDVENEMLGIKDHFMKIDDELIEQIVTLCPQLQQICIDFPVKGPITERAFSAIAKLSELTSLELFLKKACQGNLLCLRRCEKLTNLKLYLTEYCKEDVLALVEQLPALASLNLMGRYPPPDLQEQLKAMRPNLKVSLTKTGFEVIDQQLIKSGVADQEEDIESGTSDEEEDIEGGTSDQEED